jgi:hypothetical protein
MQTALGAAALNHPRKRVSLVGAGFLNAAFQWTQIVFHGQGYVCAVRKDLRTSSQSDLNTRNEDIGDVRASNWRKEIDQQLTLRAERTYITRWTSTVKF